MRAASPFLLLILCCSGKAAYSHRYLYLYLYLYSAVLVQVGAFLLPASQHDEKVNVGMETSAPLWTRRSSSLTSPFAATSTSTSTSTFTSLRAPARLQRSKLLILLVRVDDKGCDNDSGSDSDSARSTAASGSRPTTRTSTGTMCTSTNTLVELPVFPLRKFPRLPTDRLTLNLYEERYLQMAESILLKAAQTQSTTNSTGTGTGTPLFGALFVAGKPQLVTGGGRGPIVPLVEAGDIGTVFAVSDWEEALVPTIGNQILRRRIKLNAIGITRFRIDSIVSDGTGVSSCTATTSSTTIQQQRQQQQPYILVNATLLSDNTMADPWDDEDNEYLYKTLREILQEADDSRRKGSTTTTTTTRSSFSMADGIEMLTTTEPPALVEFAQVFAAIREIMNHMQDDGDEEDYSDSVSSYYYEECLSFFATSLLLNAKQTPPALVPLLELQSTRERIYRLLKLLNKQRT